MTQHSDSEILLVAINAKYIHTAFGLRYLLANLHELRSRAMLIEHSINEFPLTIVESILQYKPKIVGIGVYIWKVTEKCTQNQFWQIRNRRKKPVYSAAKTLRSRGKLF